MQSWQHAHTNNNKIPIDVEPNDKVGIPNSICCIILLTATDSPYQGDHGGEGRYPSLPAETHLHR
jgi:hypothetical protein